LGGGDSIQKGRGVYELEEEGSKTWKESFDGGTFVGGEKATSKIPTRICGGGRTK